MNKILYLNKRKHDRSLDGWWYCSIKMFETFKEYIGIFESLRATLIVMPLTQQ